MDTCKYFRTYIHNLRANRHQLNHFGGADGQNREHPSERTTAIHISAGFCLAPPDSIMPEPIAPESVVNGGFIADNVQRWLEVLEELDDFIHAQKVPDDPIMAKAAGVAV